MQIFDIREIFEVLMRELVGKALKAFDINKRKQKKRSMFFVEMKV